MSTKKFQGKGGKVPFPRNLEEHYNNNMIAGMSEQQALQNADHKMCQDVFGAGYKLNAEGFPIETGRGSAANPVNESAAAMEREKSAAEQAKMRLGWHKGLDSAFDPRSAA